MKILPGEEDPAYPIMRKAISLAPYYLELTKHYEADLYLKMTLYLKKIADFFKNENDSTIVIKEGSTITEESINKIIFNKPDQIQHKVISTISSNPRYNEDNFDALRHMQWNFYMTNNKSIVSPLSPRAFSHYTFTYEGYYKDNNHIINKIKVTPKRNNKTCYSGHIYIVDQSWSIHSVNLNFDTGIGKINIYQNYNSTNGITSLPFNYGLKWNIAFLGNKIDIHYTGNLSYTNILVNENIETPLLLKKQLPIDYSDNETNTKNVNQTLNRNQRKIEKIVAKEKLSKMDMLRLTRIHKKEISKKSNKHESLEIKDNYLVEYSKDTLNKNSIYFEELRPIPLTSEELYSYEIRDSLKSIVQKADSARTSSESILLKLLLSEHKYYSTDSSSYFKYHGIYVKSHFNAVDGFSYQQKVSFHHELDSNRNIDIFGMLDYKFSRNKIMWSTCSNFKFAPLRRGILSISTGQNSFDFNNKYGIDPTLNSYSALYFKEHYMKLYQRDFLSFKGAIDPINGLQIILESSYNEFQELFNTTDYSFFKKKKTYEENIPQNEQLRESHLNDQTDASLLLKISYTPRQRYRIKDGRKELVDSKYPTFNINYMRGFPDIFNSDSDYELIYGDISQKKEWGISNAFNWQVGAGYFSRNDQMHFSRFQHFNTSEIPVNFKSWENAFLVLDDYRYSTNEWYAKAHVSYTTPYLFLKFLPWMSNRLWTENLYTSYLTQPNYKNYIEVGYSMNKILSIGSAGVFAGFEDGSYARWGFRVGINID
ncbi:DUF5686 family protein [Carboxylicivirga marina]|uniref:DUF5686 family protein n=1 Tax=Carboxylicivirga marina TaxID=2800988 RepID=UPI002592557B|nr:DUF5686 family protein [Carboxylicivirga marina]